MDAATIASVIIKNNDKIKELKGKVIKWKHSHYDLYNKHNIDTYKRFDYRYKYTKFIGRTAELNRLIKFCNTNDLFSWWVITGPAGSGKSRLAKELCENIKWPESILAGIEYLNNIILNRNISGQLLVVDYVEGSGQEIGKLIKKCKDLSYAATIKIRILLLEREGRKKEDTYWFEPVLSGAKGAIAEYFYKENNGDNNIKNDDDDNNNIKNDFLYLEKLDSDKMLEIMLCYSKKYHLFSKNKRIKFKDKKAYEKKYKEAFENKLKELEDQYYTPLWAMIFAESIIKKKDNSVFLSKAEVLNFIYQRELSKINGKIQNGNNTDEHKMIENNVIFKLLIASSICNGWDINNFKKKDNYADDLMRFMGFLYNIDISDLCSYFKQILEINRSRIVPLKPDLLGEYFILLQVLNIYNNYCNISNELPRLDSINGFKQIDILVKLEDNYNEAVRTLLRICRDFKDTLNNIFIEFMSSIIIEYLLKNENIDENEYDFSLLDKLIISSRIENLSSLKFSELSFDNLQNVIINNVNIVNENQFSHCLNLTSFCCNKATQLESASFQGCVKLFELDIPLVQHIGNNCFEACTSLEEILLPQVTTIGDNAFEGCINFKRLYLPSVKSVGTNCFQACTSLEEILLPQVTTIGDNAFSKCTSLKKVFLPCATLIGNNCFDECRNLQEVYLSKIPKLGKNAFYRCNNNKIFIPLSLDNVKQYNKELGAVKIIHNKPITRLSITYHYAIIRVKNDCRRNNNSQEI